MNAQTHNNVGPGPVVVAMSGGVDSSTAAGLLREQGHDVIGVTLKLYDATGTAASIGGRCCTPRDIDDARQVAAVLGIPHYVVDQREAFSREVVDDFVAEYRAGRTPNPCVRCNQHLKFGPLVHFARAVGASALATGHYARVSHDGGTLRLSRAVDRDKDQAYFLFGVRPDLFHFVRFPLGDLTKPEVRQAARRLGIPTADKPDSHELCFVPNGDHKAFLAARGGGRAGQIVDEGGQVLAKHEGTHEFTVGQRKGLPALGGGVPRFVLRIDPSTGSVHVGPRDRLGRQAINVDEVRWFADPPADGVPQRAHVQIRHHSMGHPATITRTADGVTVAFDDLVNGVAPGQAAVFFADDERLVGGGWIADDQPAV